MKLVTKEIEKLMPKIGATSAKDSKDIKVPLKLFHPMSSWTAYVTELNPVTGEAFGFVEIHRGEGELGYIDMNEIQATVVRGLPIERDMYWNPETTLAQVMSGVTKDDALDLAEWR